MEEIKLEHVPELHYGLDSFDGDDSPSVAKVRHSEYAKKEEDAIKALIDYLHESLTEVTKQFDVVFYKLPLHKETPSVLTKGTTYQKVFKACGSGEVGPTYNVSKCYGIPEILSTTQSYNQCALFDRLHPTKALYIFSFKKELEYTGLLKVEKLGQPLDLFELAYLENVIVYTRFPITYSRFPGEHRSKIGNVKNKEDNKMLVLNVKFKEEYHDYEKTTTLVGKDYTDTSVNILNVLMSDSFY